jgi:hypothetical protein
MHGIGQGNGAGPAIWAVLSTPLLNILRKRGFGCEFIAPISQLRFSFSGYSFVDDTDLIQALLERASHSEIVSLLQRSIDTWEGSLKATGGAIVPEKTFWQLIDFKFHAGTWQYKSIADSPGRSFVNDINGIRKELQRLEPSQAETTLGVDLALDGNTLQQARKMIDTAQKWADNMRTGRISRDEAWLAITSTIWRTLAYPLPSLNLTKPQCEDIMAPILRYGLPAMGICRTFPRKMVFAPTKYMGLGFTHLYTLQETARLKDIIHHSFKNTITGRLYRTSIELLILEIGMGTSLHSISFPYFSNLASNSLVKSTWKFLYDHQIDFIITFVSLRNDRETRY